MPRIIFVGGGLDSFTGVSIAEIAGFNDTTYAPSALDINNGQASWGIATCRDPVTLAFTTVAAGNTWNGHFSWNFTNPYANGNNQCFVNDSAGFPWVAIRCNGGSPTFGLYYNSGTGAAPVWTQLGANFAMPQNSAPYQRIDIIIGIDPAGTNHIATVYNKEVQQATGTFAQAAFTNIQTMQIFAGGGAANHCMVWEVAMSENLALVGGRIGYSLPTAAGANAGWTGTFNQVNPVVCTDATSNTAAAAALKTTYAFGDIVIPAAHQIASVWHWMRAQNNGASPGNIKSVCRSGGTDFPAAINSPNLGLGLGPIAMNYNVDPNTGLAWTQANFNAAEFGYLSAA